MHVHINSYAVSFWEQQGENYEHAGIDVIFSSNIFILRLEPVDTAVLVK
jgi:hypothetical protein